MKVRTLSILFSILALCLIAWYNIEYVRAFNAFQPIAEGGIRPVIIGGNPNIKLISLLLAVAGLILGLFSLLKSEKRAKLYIIVSALVVVCVMVPFWRLFV